MPALDRVSFSVPAGTMLGIVGSSGSGKSTIARLLQGINRDYSGFLKIDGADLREINLRHLRQSLGVVLQDNFLFRGSIRDNIIAGRPGLTLADAVRAARLAGAEEFIERMPNGYETYIEEGSPNLSGGQKQRLAIARALIHDPRILILDEATSALDPESEAVVNANLLRIATRTHDDHRLAPAVVADRMRPDPGAGAGPAWSTSRRTRAARALLDLPPALGAAEPPSGRPRARPCGRARSPMERRVMSKSDQQTPEPWCGAGPSGRPDPAGDPRVPVAVDGDRQRADTTLGAGIIWIITSMVFVLICCHGADPGRPGRDRAGVVVSQSPTILVQPLETAIVRSIEVREGQTGEGRPGPGTARPDLRRRRPWRAEAQVASLEAEVARLQAEAEGKPFDYTGSTPTGRCRRRSTAIARPSRRQGRELCRSRSTSSSSVIARSRSDADGLPRTSWSRAEYRADAQRARGDAGRAAGSIRSLPWTLAPRWSAAWPMRSRRRRAQSAIRTRCRRAGRLSRRLAGRGFAEALRSDAGSKRCPRAVEQGQAAPPARRAARRADATVQSVAKVSVGSVMQSGQQFITLVPADAPLEIEANISGRDNGFVHVGDPVAIKFDTFPYSQYGMAEGMVRIVSPGQLHRADEARNPTSMRRAGAEPAPSLLPDPHRDRSRGAARRAGRLSVIPGMPVTADIKVGKRTVLQYLLGWVMPVAKEAMREP